MLKELQINNFLSYEKETIKFPPSSTIAVVGDNGHGKSSMLEAVRFALYGDGRDDLNGLIRLGSNSGMSVRLVLEVAGGEMTVERGVKKSGGGYTMVWMGDTIAAKGGAKPSNNKAQDMIDSVLGVDKDMFSLTAFFGLGANDTLMQVRPAERLETLQKLAGIDVCIQFNKVASDKMKDLRRLNDIDNGSVAFVVDSIKDVDALTEELTEKNNLLEGQKRKSDDLAAQRLELLRNEERYRSMINEKERLQERYTNDTNRRDTNRDRRERLRNQFEEMKVDNESNVTKRDKAKYELGKVGSEEFLQTEIDGLDSQIAEMKVGIELRETAIGHESDNCPLCNSEIDETVYHRWVKELEVFKKAIGGLRQGRSEKKSELERRRELEKKIERYQRQIKTLSTDSTEMKAEGREIKKEIDQISAEIGKTKDRLDRLAMELNAYDEVVAEIEEIDSKRNNVLETIGSLQTATVYLREEISESKTAKRAVAALRKKMREREMDIVAYNIVAEGFSRYAIPVQLLRKLRTALEKRATRIYQQFNNGQIRIDDIEGSRPGVEFVLMDEMGVRAYKALSSGEKVMIFLAVRVALTQIINSGRDNRVQFLILDEIAGNLSPTKRESLTKLINVLLRKYFAQVLLVSHVELRDIFNKTLKVVKVDGVSHVH